MRADNTRKTRQTTADGAASFLLREIIFINRVAERWWRIFEYLLSKIRRTVSKFTRPISRPGNIARKKKHHEISSIFLGKKRFRLEEEISRKSLENGATKKKKVFFFLKTTISNWYWKNLYSRSRKEWKKKKKKKVYGILREELI